MTKRGKYIVVEGGDGVGKSTAIHILATIAAKKLGIETIIVEEPDGAIDSNGQQLVPVSEALRKIIKAKEFERSPLTNVLLFTASRRENWLQAIQPALERGAWVFSARNYYSTIVYQGYGEGWDISHIDDITNEYVGEAYANPDYSFILDLPEDERTKRLALRKGRTDLDTFESKPSAFQIGVGNGYRQLSTDRTIPLISAAPPAEEVADIIWKMITDDNH